MKESWKQYWNNYDLYKPKSKEDEVKQIRKDIKVLKKLGIKASLIWIENRPYLKFS